MDIKKEFRKQFPPRRRDSSKTDYGRVFVVAGSSGLSGACVMTTLAALRSGAGLVTVGVPKSLMSPLAKRLTEAMTFPLSETKQGTLARSAARPILRFLAKESALAIGPGLSLNRETQTVIRKVILSSRKPMVIDADGLNAFKGHTILFKKLKAPAILTPHSGEFVRLFGGKIPKTASERKHRAIKISRKFKVILVLKGHRTVVAAPTGEVYVNQSGNPGMATGGSGDVLTGVIAAFLAQKIEPFKAACLGVFVHGYAGDLAAKQKGEISLIASDIIAALPSAFQGLIRH